VLPGAALLFVALGISAMCCHGKNSGGVRRLLKRSALGGQYSSFGDDWPKVDGDLEAPPVTRRRYLGRGGMRTTAPDDDEDGDKLCDCSHAARVAEHVDSEPHAGGQRSVPQSPAPCASARTRHASAPSPDAPAASRTPSTPPSALLSKSDVEGDSAILTALSQAAACRRDSLDASPMAAACSGGRMGCALVTTAADHDLSIAGRSSREDRNAEAISTVRAPATVSVAARTSGSPLWAYPAREVSVDPAGVAACRGNVGSESSNGVHMSAVEGLGLNSHQGTTPVSPPRSEQCSLTSLSETLQRARSEQAAEHAAASLLSFARARSAGTKVAAAPSSSQAALPHLAARVGHASSVPTTNTIEAGIDGTTGRPAPKPEAVAALRRFLGLGLIGVPEGVAAETISSSSPAGGTGCTSVFGSAKSGQKRNGIGIQVAEDAAFARGAAGHPAAPTPSGIASGCSPPRTPSSSQRSVNAAYSPGCEASERSLDVALREMLTLRLPPMQSLRPSPSKAAGLAGVEARHRKFDNTSQGRDSPARSRDTAARGDDSHASAGSSAPEGCAHSLQGGGLLHSQSNELNRSTSLKRVPLMTPPSASISGAKFRPRSGVGSPPSASAKAAKASASTAGSASGLPGCRSAPGSADAATSPFSCAESTHSQSTPRHARMRDARRIETPDSSSRVIWSLVDYIQRLHGSIDEGAFLEITREIDFLSAREAEILASVAEAHPTVDATLGEAVVGSDGSSAKLSGGPGEPDFAAQDLDAVLDEEAKRELSRVRLRIHFLRSELEQIAARQLPEPMTLNGGEAYVPFDASKRGEDSRRTLHFDDVGG